MNASQRASCSSATHSFGWCACAMWPGPQMIVGIVGVVEQRGLGAERHLADVRRRRCTRSPSAAIVAAVVRVEAGQRRQRVELDVRVGGDRVHLRQEARGERPHVGEERVGIVERQVADLEVERSSRAARC